jgi:hypothetical protein
MPDIKIDPARVGEGIAYIKAITRSDNVPMPPAFPQNKVLGAIRWAQVDIYSLNTVAAIGFGGFLNVGGSSDIQVLVQHYLYTSEVENKVTDSPVRSYVYGAGFRVALAMYGFKANSDASFGLVAAKAQVEGKRIAVDIRTIGMPKAPAIPGLLTNGQNFNVDSYRLLQNFVDDVSKYLLEKNNELEPLPVAATIDAFPGDALIDTNPGIRYAMWSIMRSETIAQALAKAKKFTEVDEAIVRSIYAAMMSRPEVIRPGSAFENQKPNAEMVSRASRWINGYQNA